MSREGGAALVVEDLAAVRRGLERIVAEVFPGVVVEGAADLRSARQRLVREQPFRLALIDLGLPDGSGIELIRELRLMSPDTLRVVTTIYDDDEHLFAAIGAGADGYLLKEQPAHILKEHLRRLDEGTPALSPSIARRMLAYFRASAAAIAAQEGSVGLTTRETEVLSLIARGLRRSEVAKLLGISENTVARYIKDMYRKLGISSRAEAAIEAQRRGLL